MENTFFSIQLEPSKGPSTFEEGFSYIIPNDHNEEMNHTENDSARNEEDDPLVEKIENMSVGSICEPTFLVPIANDCSEIEIASSQTYMDAQDMHFDVEIEAEKGLQLKENVTIISEIIFNPNGNNLIKENMTDPSATSKPFPLTTELSNLTSQAQFMLNLHLNNGNFNENIVKTDPVAPKAYDEFISNEVKKSMIFAQKISDTRIYKNNRKDTAKITSESTPSTTESFDECSEDEKEHISSKTHRKNSDSTNKQLITDIPVKERTSQPDIKQFIRSRKKKLSRSTTLRKSCDSQFSDSSSSADETDKTSTSSSSSGILEDFNHDETSSPQLKQKRKCDIFKDTDSGNELETAETDEKSTHTKSKKKFSHQIYVSDDEAVYPFNYPAESVNLNHKNTSISDFELMMQQKKAEKQKSRKRSSGFITSNDDLIDQLIDRMEEAAYEDRQLNKKGLPAIRKVSMLKYVVSQLRKKDLQSIFLEHNILGTLTEWLSPLPTKCLPCLQIRESIIRLLDDFPRIDTRLLRHSGIGRILRFLRDHPDETRENQERCSQLIVKWTRPIFDPSFDYRAMTKKERQQRDYEISLKYTKERKKTQSNFKPIRPKILDIHLSSPDTMEAARPGEPGWIPRARVPQLSVRDYIRRPESKLSCEILTKVRPSRFEVLSKKYQQAKRNKVMSRRSNMLSIGGDKM